MNRKQHSLVAVISVEDLKCENVSSCHEAAIANNLLLNRFVEPHWMTAEPKSSVDRILNSGNCYLLSEVYSLPSLGSIGQTRYVMIFYDSVLLLTDTSAIRPAAYFVTPSLCYEQTGCNESDSRPFKLSSPSKRREKTFWCDFGDERRIRKEEWYSHSTLFRLV